MPNPRTVGFGLSAVLAAVVGFTSLWEGYNPRPYQDVVGVRTVCAGHTGAISGKTYTKAECDALLVADLTAAYEAVQDCVRVPLTLNQESALTDFALNVGRGTLCRSTLARMANRGDPPSAWCPQLNRFVYARGVRLRGLIRRRNAEVVLCMKT